MMTGTTTIQQGDWLKAMTYARDYLDRYGNGGLRSGSRSMTP